MVFDNNDNNTSSGNKGNKGKFSERLKKMRRDRLKIKKKGTLKDEDEEEFALITTFRNVFKIILALPSVVYTHVTDKSKKIDDKVDKSTNEVNDILVDDLAFDEITEEDLIYQEAKKVKVNKIKDIDVSLLKKKREYFLKKANYVAANKIKEATDNIELEEKKVKLQKEIIDLIKKKLVKNINDLEILQSEFYILNEMELGDTYLDECQQDIKEIKKLLSKVKVLKEKYDFLKDNVDFQYMLEYGDDLLIDKILELKEICSRDDIRQTIEDYKLLDEYKYLYLKIDKLQEDTIRFEEEKLKKAEELKQRDVDFDKLKNDIYDVDRENERYNSFVSEQDRFLKELEDRVSQIDSYERVTYRLKGFNQLLGNSFKYLGLLLVNPLKGLVPGIATQTLVTKNIIRNLYNNLEWEEDRRMVYDAIDYSTSINSAINNLDDTASLVDSTLNEIVSLKSKYEREFSKHEGSFSSYRDAIKKLNKIENAVLGNKIKIDSMRVKMKEKEKRNENKIKRVKKLNTSNNS